jgi:N4-gp56 family major capsid protein
MTQHIYGNGTTTATSGANTITHFYDRAGVKAANRINIFQQFADKKQMPTKHGKTFKISKFLHMYDRTQDKTDPSYNEFLAKGFMTSRSYDDVSLSLANAELTEGAGAVNKRVLKKVTFETSLNRYGEMIDYTDEVELFSEDVMQVRYREELGALANSRYEDLIMMDLLSTGTVMHSGAAVAEIGIGEGNDAAGTLDGVYKISYDLIRKGTRKLFRNRAVKNTSIVTGSNKIDTRTVAKAYYAIIGAEVKGDLETLTRGSNFETEYVYIPAHKYASAGNLAEGEVGAMHEVRFIEAEGMPVYAGAGAAVPDGYTGSLSKSTLPTGRFYVQNSTGTSVSISGVDVGSNPAKLSKSYGSAIAAGAIVEVDTADDATLLAGVTGIVKLTEGFDVFPVLFPSQGAFATVGLKGRGKIQFNAKSPADVGNDNPYATKGFFSYNFFYAGILLKEECVLKMLVGASA